MSFIISYLPVLLGRIGPFVFVLSGLISLFSVWLFLRLIPDRPPYLPIVAIFAIVNVMYFANIIPPIPLALKDSGIFHSISRLEPGKYEVITEIEPWYSFLQTRQKVRIITGNDLYAYSAVFAPSRLALSITHEWQYKGSDGWQTTSMFSFPIIGGRDGGYKGYSIITNVKEGFWRVNIKTPTGQLIGRINFEVDIVLAPPNLVIESR